MSSRTLTKEQIFNLLFENDSPDLESEKEVEQSPEVTSTEVAAAATVATDAEEPAEGRFFFDALGIKNPFPSEFLGIKKPFAELEKPQEALTEITEAGQQLVENIQEEL